MWIVNVDIASIDDLKEFIYNRYERPTIENKYAVLNFECNNDNYSPQDDKAFRVMLRQLISENKSLMTISIETPSRPFGTWKLSEVCYLYGLTDENGSASLNRFPSFKCGRKDLNDQSSQEILETLMKNLNIFYKYTRINSNEASKSLFVYLYLVAGTSLYDDQFMIEPQLDIVGHNGHGPVDYAICSSETSKIINVTEVKDQKFKKGIAQNAVQIETALSNRKRKFDEMTSGEIFRDKVIGIITDAEKWYFLECFYDHEKPKFKLSDSMIVSYNTDKMESDVKTVLGRISWLLEEVQKPVDDLQTEDVRDKKKKKS